MNDHKRLIRGIVLDILSGREEVVYPPNQFKHLVLGVAEVMFRRSSPASKGMLPREIYPVASQEDEDAIREVFWDLFIEKVITIGCNPDNPNLPWFRLHSERGPL